MLDGPSCSTCIILSNQQITEVLIRLQMRILICTIVVRIWHKTHFCMTWPFFSSPEPLGSQGELIVYPCSGVRCCRGRCCCRRRQQCLNIFSSETAWPTKAKLYVEPPWEGGTKVYINGPGHMARMAAMPIYGKNL